MPEKTTNTSFEKISLTDFSHNLSSFTHTALMILDLFLTSYFVIVSLLIFFVNIF